MNKTHTHTFMYKQNTAKGMSPEVSAALKKQVCVRHCVCVCDTVCPCDTVCVCDIVCV